MAVRRERDSAKRRRRRMLSRMKVAIKPAVLRALHAWRCRLHVVLGVEMGPRAVRRAARMHDRHLTRVEQRL